MSFITIATEDELSEAVGVRLVTEILPGFEIAQMLGRRGNGYLKAKCQSFNQMAIRHPVLLITDLDNRLCAKSLIDSWFGNLNINVNLKFRVAVREMEAWLLADHHGMRELLGRGGNNIAPNPDGIQNPKEYLLERAKRAPSEIKNDLVRARGSAAVQGLGYNARLSEFVRTTWSLEQASQRSESLVKAVERLKELL